MKHWFTLSGCLLALLVSAASCQLVGRDGSTPVSSASDEPHAALFLEDRYPSAKTCGQCHPRHYREWSASPHSYAQLSPVFNAMYGKILQLTNGTAGDFCIRCHTPVGMAIGEPLFVSNLERHPTSREGITCIACHRVNREWGKVSGRRALVSASLVAPVFGPTGGEEVQRVIESPDFRVSTSMDGRRPVHSDAEQFFQLSEPSFCGACHDVNLPNGFRLEEAFSEYKKSPAAAQGISCQDCHMGKEPGIPSGYDHGPAARVGGTYTRDRKITNHTFVGPDYPVVHPGIFPHDLDAGEFATMAEWIAFDVDAGWGTDDFEEGNPTRVEFPERWTDAEERYAAREIIDRQLARRDEVTEQRRALLRRGYVLGDVVTEAADPDGVRFRVEVRNGTQGHNVPTGFTAERLVWLKVTVRDRNHREIFVSGDLDPNGDVRDAHSLYVHNGELPRDEQLFTLRSQFLTRNLRGGEREQVLAVNVSQDALPFVRPEVFPSVLSGRPGGARLHRYSIEPGGRRWAHYEIPAERLSGPGPYRADIQLKAAMVPVHLVGAIQDVGFDYGLSPRELAKRIVDGHLILWERTEILKVEGD